MIPSRYSSKTVRGIRATPSKYETFDKHGLTNLEQLNTELVSEDSYKKSRVKHATLYVQNQTGLKNIFKLVTDVFRNWHS